MEELQLLVNMVANLPSMALWVLAGFFAYKTIIIGSIYGVTRLGIIKLHDVYVNRKSVISYKLDSGVTVGVSDKQALNDLLIAMADSAGYIKYGSVRKLMEAYVKLQQEEKKDASSGK